MVSQRVSLVEDLLEGGGRLEAGAGLRRGGSRGRTHPDGYMTGDGWMNKWREGGREGGMGGWTGERVLRERECSEEIVNPDKQFSDLTTMAHASQ